ncbi:BRCA2-interacting transcriptional repressor EMSY [Anopheles darlingi]|uniref:BRCA2-interacting transcriptional repressor EMSY n=1 Tax=Anopheles darlingi TaxID=43151 RepID=UPI0021003351|nr:BRCA2-interacting transcriptional repressor EMSY [Anopheles darlingi]
MWPMKLDMTLDECRGVLRRLELESYGTIISAFRAQGSLCKEKARILEDLRRVLRISSDRHRAEARRVANDERLTTVAELVWGPNSSRDWCREGHRTFPVLPRSVPHTALSYIANTVYEQLTRANCKLPHPAKTSCDRFGKAEELYKFQLIKMEPKLAANGFVRDAAVVTSDPLQDIMSKSFIDTDLLLAEAKWKAKGQEEDTLHSEVVHTDVPPPDMEDFNVDIPSPCSLDDQPSLSDILLDTPKAAASNGGGSVDSQRASAGKQSNKSTERAKKTSNGGSGKRNMKVKSPYPATKPSKQARTNSVHSPHLIHSYAVPYDPATVTNGVSGEPPQLQQHLTSNMPYQPQQANHSTASGQPQVKSQQYSSSSSSTPHSNFTSPKATPLSSQQSSASVASPHSSTYCQQREIYLPSSKKDIQHNISKLNPTNSLPGTPLKSSVNSTVRSANREVYNKLPPHLSQPLLSYHKKSPSKNILIPTSAAAATLASLGLPRAPSVDHFNHYDSEEATKTRDRAELTNDRQHGKIHAQQDIPNPTIVFSATPSHASAENHSNNLLESNTLQERTDQSANLTAACSTLALNSPNAHVGTPMKGSAVQNLPSNTSSDIKQSTNLVGFTSVKSARRISIQKVQLVPLVGADGTPASISTTPGSASISKNNVFILPKSFPSGSVPGITPGQKIILPKNDTTPSPPTSLQRSPPKVIVQPVPDVNSLVLLDDGLDNRHCSTSHQRQLFGVEESSNKPTKNSDSLVESENVQTMLSNLSGSTEGGSIPLRKITIASRQLVPFKGTLHGTVLPGTAAISGAKKMKLSNESSINAADHARAGAQREGSTGFDWEIEMDRSEDARYRRVPTQKTNILVRNADAEIIGTSSRGQYSEAQKTPAGLLPPAVSISPVEAEASEYDVNSSERGDDSSATDSADAEEDPEDDIIRMEEEDGIEDNDYDDSHTIEVDANTDDMVIEMDHNLDALIEEDPDGDIEADQEVEVMNDEYGQAHELMAELDDASNQYIEEHPTTNGADVVVVPAAMNFEQCSDMIELAENGDDLHEPSMLAAKDDIVCELLEIDADGNHHTRQFSYEQAIAEGLTVLPRMTKVNPSVS